MDACARVSNAYFFLLTTKIGAAVQPQMAKVTMMDGAVVVIMITQLVS
jgi:hypothetical protein